MKRRKFIIYILFFSIIIVLGFLLEHYRILPLSRVSSVLFCEARGGEYQYVFGYGKWVCNFRTSDAHKSCFDGEECEGGCFATRETIKEINDEEMKGDGKGWSEITPFQYVGECCAWRYAHSGCFPFLSNGKIINVSSFTC